MTEPQVKYEYEALQSLRKGDLIRTDWTLHSRKVVGRNPDSSEFTQRWDLTNIDEVTVPACTPILILDFDVQVHLVRIVALHGEITIRFGVNQGIFYRDFRKLVFA